LQEREYFKEVHSDPEILPELDEYLMNIAKEAGLDEEKFNNLSLSFSEAASNSIKHGNKNDVNKKIKITVKVSDSQMRIIIKDEGKGFDIDEVPDPTKEENILKDNGRGIHIMRSFLEGLSYNFTPEGTETILVLNLK
jgi:serine/threonine-protein kinase RsbW